MWQPIDTAPMEGRRMFVVKAFGVIFNDGNFPYTSDPYCVWRGNGGVFERWPHRFSPTHWMPLPDLPGAQPAQKAVAYLDLGAGGYMNLGTDLNDEQLAALPKGRHMLGIVGTYGVDGYVSAQPAPSISPVALRHVIQWLRNGCDPMKAADELEMLAAATEANP